MEAFNFESGKAKGVEVLFFEEAEIQKLRGTTPIFAAMGSLSVLYFKDYNRFVLQLNDWRYPLMRRHNISGSDSTFTFPALNNATFTLRILGSPSQDTLKNFETILMNNTRFGGKTLEASPEDKLSRKTLTAKVAETAKNIAETIKAKTETTKTKTSKKRSQLKDIKNKDFKETAHTTFNKDFFESHQKITKNFLNKRRENPNLSQALEFVDLVKTSDSKVPTHFIYKFELEEAILSNREIVSTN